MTLTEDSFSTQLLTASEIFLFAEETTLNHYETVIFLDALAVDDILEIKTYVEDPNTSTLKLDRTVRVAGVQNNPAFRINWIPSTGYRVSITQVFAPTSFKTIGWVLYSS